MKSILFELCGCGCLHLTVWGEGKVERSSTVLPVLAVVLLRRAIGTQRTGKRN